MLPESCRRTNLLDKAICTHKLKGEKLSIHQPSNSPHLTSISEKEGTKFSGNGNSNPYGPRRHPVATQYYGGIGCYGHVQQIGLTNYYGARTC